MSEDTKTAEYQGQQVEVQECPPTPEGYARMLCQVIRDGESPTNVNFAIDEVVKFVKIGASLNPEAFGGDTPSLFDEGLGNPLVQEAAKATRKRLLAKGDKKTEADWDLICSLNAFIVD